MKKAMSDLTDSDFVEAVAALGMTGTQVARALGIHQSTVSGYMTNRFKIPLDVAQRLEVLIHNRVATITEKLRLVRSTNQMTRSEMVVHSNALKQLEPKAPTLVRRVPQSYRECPEGCQRLPGHLRRADHIIRPTDPRSPLLRLQNTILPAYRLPLDKFRLYLLALGMWALNVRDRCREFPENKAWVLEATNIKALGEAARGISQRGAPYDMLISAYEFNTVSSALRYLAERNTAAPRFVTEEESRAAFALYQHWRRHKGSGYPAHTKDSCGCARLRTTGRVIRPCKLHHTKEKTP